MVLQDFILVKIFAAYFAKRNTNLGGGGSEGEAGIHFPHTPFSARPARANRFLAREARHQFRSKKVRAFSNKGHSAWAISSIGRASRLFAHLSFWTVSSVVERLVYTE